MAHRAPRGCRNRSVWRARAVEGACPQLADSPGSPGARRKCCQQPLLEVRPSPASLRASASALPGLAFAADCPSGTLSHYAGVVPQQAVAIACRLECGLRDVPEPLHRQTAVTQGHHQLRASTAQSPIARIEPRASPGKTPPHQRLHPCTWAFSSGLQKCPGPSTQRLHPPNDPVAPKGFEKIDRKRPCPTSPHPVL